MRKPRPDAFWQKLAHHQMDALKGWLLDEGLSYVKAVERLHMDFGVDTSETALGKFWERFCAPVQFAVVSEASEAAPAMAGGMDSNFAATSEAYVRQHYFMLLASRNPDQKLLASFAIQVADLDRGKREWAKLRFQRQKAAVGARLKRADQRLSERRVKLLEAKEAETRKTLGDTSLTPEQQASRIKQIFGIAE